MQIFSLKQKLYESKKMYDDIDDFSILLHVHVKWNNSREREINM